MEVKSNCKCLGTSVFLTELPTEENKEFYQIRFFHDQCLVNCSRKKNKYNGWVDLEEVFCTTLCVGGGVAGWLDGWVAG